MNRDSKGRFCKADNKAKKEIKSTKIPFLSKKHIKKEELEWSDLGKGINLNEIDENGLSLWKLCLIMIKVLQKFVILCMKLVL